MTRLYYEAPAGVQGLRPVLGALASPDRGAHLIESERWRVVIGVPYHPQ